MRNIGKFQQGGSTDKVKQFRDKHPVLDILAGFIPGVGQAQSVQDFGYAARDKNYLGMGLATLGFIPFIGGFGRAGRLLSKVDDLAEIGSGVAKGGQIRKITSKQDWSKWADKSLGELSTVNPRLTEGIVQGNPTAKAIEKTYKQIADGNVVIPEKRGVLDVGEDTFISPMLHPHSANMSPEAAIEAAIKFRKTTPKGKLVPYIIGGNKGVTDVPGGLFIPGKAAIKKGKKAGQFASGEDILTALYYSGHGKQRGANAIYDYILASARSKESKDYAMEKLVTIERILAKYSKNEERYVGLNKALRDTKKGREIAYNPDGKLNTRSLGLIPEDLVNPKSKETVKDYLKLENSLYELSTWLGAENSNSMIQMFQKVPMNTLTGNFGGKSFNASGTEFHLLGLQPIKASNADNAAQQIATLKDPSLGIITDIVDGARPTTDIIFQPKNYSILEWKKGGRLSKSNLKPRFKRS